jgi:predicted acetyltransferase
MNIQLLEIENKNGKLFFNIVDRDTNLTVGIIFTVANHIAYEIEPEFRGYGIATEALKIVTSKIDKPTLEITYNNIASKKVALKAGYVLVKNEPLFEIYECSKGRY